MDPRAERRHRRKVLIYSGFEPTPERYCGRRAKLAPERGATYTQRVRVRAPSAGSGLALLLLGATVLSACGAAGEAPTDANASLEAVLSIERVQEAGHEGSESASALAEFVILPTELDVHDTLGAAGLRSQLPEHTGCAEVVLGDIVARGGTGGGGGDATASVTGTRRFNLREPLELLEAGEVSIQAEDAVTRLALNLFPPSGSASGVIYTTPDQAAAPLPPDTLYSIRASGSGVIPPLTIEGHAPAGLADITVGGVPIEGAQTLIAGQPLDFTWAEGSGGDRVYIELADSERSLLCVFADEDGSGSLPGALTARFAPDSAIHLSVHRVREAMRPDSSKLLDAALERSASRSVYPIADRGDRGLDRGAGADSLSLETTVRFDFEVTSALRVE
jgi:hypothetical protein